MNEIKNTLQDGRHDARTVVNQNGCRKLNSTGSHRRIRYGKTGYPPSVSDLKLTCLPNPFFLIILWTGLHLTCL